MDYYLLGRNGAITTLAGSSHCCVITRQMEQLVSENFQAIKEFEKLLSVFRGQDPDRSSVKEALLSHFEELFKKVSVWFSCFSFSSSYSLCSFFF